MKHDLLIYILKFSELPLIKLGKSENLRIRLKQIIREYECEIDYDESYVIQAPSAYIKNQERQLLQDIPFDLDDEEYDFYRECTGSTELRREDNLPKIIEYFNIKKQLFDVEIELIKGINFSGFYSPRIPEKYYPIDRKAQPLLKDFSVQVNKIAMERGIDSFTAVNEIMYEYFILTGLFKEEKFNNARVNYFKLPSESFSN